MTGAPDLATARAVSKSVIHSTLFKAAMFGADANWGRVRLRHRLHARRLRYQQDVGAPQEQGRRGLVYETADHPYSEDEAAVVLEEDEIDILVDLGSGDATAKALGLRSDV